MVNKTINFDKTLKNIGIKHHYRYSFYLEIYIFHGIELKSKTLLDVGGGNGIASFYARYKDNTCKCIVADPLKKGSNEFMEDQFNKLSKLYGKGVKLHKGYTSSLPKRMKFDLILLHNSINHIGEDIISTVKDVPEHRNEYLKRLKEVLSHGKKGAKIIVADCSNKNFWGDLKLPNIFAPSINWKIHKDPNFWTDMLNELNCKHIKTNWTARRELLYLGKFFLANKVMSYFTDSHFVSVYEKK